MTGAPGANLFMGGKPHGRPGRAHPITDSTGLPLMRVRSAIGHFKLSTHKIGMFALTEEIAVAGIKSTVGGVGVGEGP